LAPRDSTPVQRRNTFQYCFGEKQKNSQNFKEKTAKTASDIRETSIQKP